MTHRIGTLKFGGAIVRVYEVSECCFDPSEDGESPWGTYNLGTRDIHIQEGLDRGFFAQVLLHEAAHAALHLGTYYGYVDSESERLYGEENVCEVVGNGFSQNWKELQRMINAKKERK